MFQHVLLMTTVSTQAAKECLWWPLGAGAQSNPREGNGGEGLACGTNRKPAFFVPPLLSAAHEGFIPNFAVVQAVFSAYLTQYVLPAAYITRTAE